VPDLQEALARERCAALLWGPSWRAGSRAAEPRTCHQHARLLMGAAQAPDCCEQPGRHEWVPGSSSRLAPPRPAPPRPGRTGCAWSATTWRCRAGRWRRPAARWRSCGGCARSCCRSRGTARWPRCARRLAGCAVAVAAAAAACAGGPRSCAGDAQLCTRRMPGEANTLEPCHHAGPRGGPARRAGARPAPGRGRRRRGGPAAGRGAGRRAAPAGDAAP
jgi:hypothetical protein